MADTVSLRIHFNIQPPVTVNDVRVSISKVNLDGSETFTAAQQFVAPNGEQLVSFDGLLRANYVFRILEMSLHSTTVIVRQIAKYNVVPDNNTVTYYEPIEIQIDSTPGTLAGTTSFTFNGSGGTYDWRGRQIFVERVGQGTMQRGVQYSWDTSTGTFTLLQAGDSLQHLELFNAEFGLVVSGSAGVAPSTKYSGFLKITGATTLTAADVGKLIMIQGASNYFVITMPDINTVPDFTPFYFEAGIGAHKCVRLKCFTGQTIDFGKGARQDIKFGVCESMEVMRDPSIAQWRSMHADGNFLKAGRVINTDAEIADEYNCVEMDGSSLSVNDYARLYEDHVLQLPGSQVVAFVGWAADPTKYSLASGGVFHVPDRRNLFDRNWDGSRVPGTYQAEAVKAHLHLNGIADDKLDADGSNVMVYGSETTEMPGLSHGNIAQAAGSNTRQGRTSTTGAIEGHPINYTIRKFILI